MSFLDELNASVPIACSMPRVRFEIGLGAVPENWLKKKHADGAVHEPATIAAFIAIQKRFACRTIFDVGALWGYFSLLCSALFDDAEITAFEMHGGAIPALQKNVAPVVKCVNAVVSDRVAARVPVWINGFNIFEEPEGGWANLAQVPGAMKPRGLDNRGRSFCKVDFITLDAYCRDNTPPDLIKIDVEGYQAKAVCGARETLMRHKPIVIIELHDPEKIARFNTTNKATVQPLFDLGYRGFWCGNFRSPEARYEAITEMGEAQEKLCIMVFVPKERL